MAPDDRRAAAAAIAATAAAAAAPSAQRGATRADAPTAARARVPPPDRVWRRRAAQAAVRGAYWRAGARPLGRLATTPAAAWAWAAVLLAAAARPAAPPPALRGALAPLPLELMDRTIGLRLEQRLAAYEGQRSVMLGSSTIAFMAPLDDFCNSASRRSARTT